jgi:uncharacterized membrane protein
MELKKPRWHDHPHVRSGKDLSFGERAADQLKHWFGSWPFFFAYNVIVFGYIGLSLTHVFKFDPFPFILLNLGLSWLAGQQGSALQISSNRGDRIASELAMSTYKNGQEILQINRQQTQILEELRSLRTSIEDK